jgi:hypothetical protein
VEKGNGNPSERLTFYGLEKNATTIRLAKMNPAVHVSLCDNIIQTREAIQHRKRANIDVLTGLIIVVQGRLHRQVCYSQIDSIHSRNWDRTPHG